MERKIGETFEYQGKTYKVIESLRNICDNCAFSGECDATETVVGSCSCTSRLDGKNVIFKEVKVQKRKMKEDKYSLKISRNSGNTTLDGYPIATYSNDELKILKRLLTKVLGEVNQYIEVKE